MFLDGAPLGSVCVFSRRTLKDVGWSAHHTAVLRGLADAASTEVGDGSIHTNAHGGRNMNTLLILHSEDPNDEH